MTDAAPRRLLTGADLARRYGVRGSAVCSWMRRYRWDAEEIPTQSPVGRAGMRMPVPYAQTANGAPLYALHQLDALDTFVATMSAHPLSSARVPRET